MNKSRWIRFATLMCLIFMVVIYYLWQSEVRIYIPDKDQLSSPDKVTAFLEKKEVVDAASPGRLLIPTGVFIQSLKFTSPSDVNITGYIWQKYPESVPDSSRGVILPEQVFSGSTVMEEAYRRTDGELEVVGWYFDVTLRQPFDYSKYPLDRQDIWMRLWFKEFDHDVVLVPDFDAYDIGVMAPGSAFGLDGEIVPGGWVIDETYFYYRLANYDTNFGINNYVGQENFPELHFNIVVTRKFLNAFTVHLVPCLIVALLLFSVLMIATADREKASIFDFSTSGAIGTCSALFFVILLAHIQLRQQFASSGIVYLEYFYIVSYLTVLAVALNTYILTLDSIGNKHQAFHREDNFIPKLLFWPIYLGLLAVITAIYFV